MMNNTVISIGDTNKYLISRCITYPETLSFHGKDAKLIGTLSLASPMTFKGDVDASAEVFLKAICQKYNELEADAKRYRWLRSSDTSTGTLAELARTAHSEDRFDAAIDAAIAAGGSND